MTSRHVHLYIVAARRLGKEPGEVTHRHLILWSVDALWRRSGYYFHAGAITGLKTMTGTKVTIDLDTGTVDAGGCPFRACEDG